MRYSVLIASLYAPSSLALAAWSFIIWQKRRQPFYLALYLVVLAALVLGLLAAVRSSALWPTIGCLSLASLIFLVGSGRRYLEKDEVRSLTRFTVATLVISLLTVSGGLGMGAWQARILTQQQKQALSNGVVTLQNLDGLAQQQLGKVVTSTDLNGKGSLEAAAAALPGLLVQDQLDFLTLLDEKGVVIVRAHRPGHTGDSMGGTLSTWQAHSSGLGLDDEQRPVAAALSSIRRNGQIFAQLFGGYVLDSARLAQTPALRNLGLRTMNTLVSRNVPGDILTTRDLRTLTDLSINPAGIHTVVRFQTTSYQVISQPVPTLPDGAYPFQLVSASPYGQ